MMHDRIQRSNFQLVLFDHLDKNCVDCKYVNVNLKTPLQNRLRSFQQRQQVIRTQSCHHPDQGVAGYFPHRITARFEECYHFGEHSKRTKILRHEPNINKQNKLITQASCVRGPPKEGSLKGVLKPTRLEPEVFRRLPESGPSQIYVEPLVWSVSLSLV